MYVLLTTGHFDRRVVKFTRAHPELKKPLAKVLKHLEADPFDAVLSTVSAQWRT